MVEARTRHHPPLPEEKEKLEMEVSEMPRQQGKRMRLLYQLIRECVEEIGDPLMEHIIKRTGAFGFKRDETKCWVAAMVSQGELRMKEDEIDHDWLYCCGENWDKHSRENDMLQMIGDRVVIELETPEDITKGGIVLPDNAKDRPTRGVVVTVGPGKVSKKGKRVPLQVAVGDTVLIGAYEGDEVEVGEKTIRIVREDNILAKVQ